MPVFASFLGDACYTLFIFPQFSPTQNAVPVRPPAGFSFIELPLIINQSYRIIPQTTCGGHSPFPQVVCFADIFSPLASKRSSYLLCSFYRSRPWLRCRKGAEIDPWKGCRGFALDFLTPKADKKKGWLFTLPTVSAFPRRSDVGFFFPNFFAETLDFLR